MADYTLDTSDPSFHELDGYVGAENVGLTRSPVHDLIFSGCIVHVYVADYLEYLYGML